MKWPYILIVSGVLSLAAGLIFSSLDMHDGNPDIGVGSVQWNSSAHSVAEQVAEADAIVRVKVDKAHPSRALVIPLPPGTRREELKADVVPFTDSGMRVEDVYKGSVTKKLSQNRVKAMPPPFAKGGLRGISLPAGRLVEI